MILPMQCPGCRISKLELNASGLWNHFWSGCNWCPTLYSLRKSQQTTLCPLASFFLGSLFWRLNEIMHVKAKLDQAWGQRWSNIEDNAFSVTQELDCLSHFFIPLILFLKHRWHIINCTYSRCTLQWVLTCICQGNHHINQDNKHLHYPPKFPYILLYSTLLSHHPISMSLLSVTLDSLVLLECLSLKSWSMHLLFWTGLFYSAKLS